ncbi:MAG: hypothetical protein JXP73_16870 [Deltaproteobacteria bacterium]|nr:hypothetical protein [Deltaproteobacteria bacterium]
MVCAGAAADELADKTASGARVEIAVVGTAEDFRWARALSGAGSPALAAARWSLVERFVAGEIFAATSRGDTLACWLDLSDAKRARLYFAAPSGRRFLLRDVALAGRGSEVDRAALAEVLDLSVAALLENERLGLTRGEAETLLAERQAASELPPKPGPAPALASARGTVQAAAAGTGQILWGLGALFAEQVLSPEFPLARRIAVEALLGFGHEAGWLAGFAAGEYQLPVEARGSDIGVKLQVLTAFAGLEAGYSRGRVEEGVRLGWRSLFGRLGAGVDFSRVLPLLGTRAVAVNLAPAHWSSAARAAWRTGRFLGLGTASGARCSRLRRLAAGCGPLRSQGRDGDRDGVSPLARTAGRLARAGASLTAARAAMLP